MVNGDEYHTQAEEEDLNAVIAESLLSFNHDITAHGGEDNTSWSNESNENKDNPKHLKDDGNEDFELENTIGEVFKSYFTSDEKKTLADKQEEHEVEKGDQVDIEEKAEQDSNNSQSFMKDDRTGISSETKKHYPEVVTDHRISNPKGHNNDGRLHQSMNSDPSMIENERSEASEDIGGEDLELAISRAFNSAFKDGQPIADDMEQDRGLSEINEMDPQERISSGSVVDNRKKSEPNRETGVIEWTGSSETAVTTNSTKELQESAHLDSLSEERKNNSSVINLDNDNKNEIKQSIEDALNSVTNDSLMHSRSMENENTDSENTNLERAIGDAFLSLSKNEKRLQEDSTSFRTNSQAYQTATGSGSVDHPKTIPGSPGIDNRKEHTLTSLGSQDSDVSKVDLSSIVQTILSQMNSSEDGSTTTNTSQLPISDSNLKELALEITNQVQEHIESDLRKPSVPMHDLPQIDENVFAHFQNEANKDDISHTEKQSGSTFKNKDELDISTAITSAVKTAIHNASMTGKTLEPLFDENETEQSKNADLEQLEMNTILHNAFNMAMENPQGLLSHLEGDGEAETAQNAHLPDVIEDAINAQDSGSKRFNYPLSTSTTTFLQSLKRSNSIDLAKTSSQKLTEVLSNNQGGNLQKAIDDRLSSISESSDDGKKKALSIAETLALHRSSMSSLPKRVYSSLNESKEVNHDAYHTSPSPLVSRLSNAISSLSSKITSTSSGGDNVMSVIRQMTYALTSNKASSHMLDNDFTTLNDILNRIKKDNDVKLTLSSIYLAKFHFQYKRATISVDDKIFSLLDYIVSSFENVAKYPSVEAEASKLQDPNRDFIASMSDSVYNTISNTYANRYKSSFFMGERPKVDTPEYKERIRLENRERKKRWREENIERNKDNDLRSRVIKRSNLIFGEADSAEKKIWTEEEFNRRRSKRLAKQKKEEEEKRNKGSINKNLTIDKVRYTVDLTSFDSNIVRLVSHVIDIVSCCVRKESWEITLPIVAVTMVSAIVVFLEDCQDTGMKEYIREHTSSLVISILDKSKFMSSHEKTSFVGRDSVSSYKATLNPPNSGFSAVSDYPSSRISSLLKMKPGSTSSILSRLSSTIKTLQPSVTDPSQSFTSVNNTISSSQNKIDEGFDNDKKRRKVDISTDHSVVTKPAIDPLRSSLTTSQSYQPQEGTTPSTRTSLWRSTNVLKMPTYKKPISSMVKLEATPELQSNLHNFGLSMSNSSPFISHKINNNTPIARKSSGLRKPGSFQKPGMYTSYDAKVKNAE